MKQKEYQEENYLLFFDMNETENYQNNWPQHVDMRHEDRRDFKWYNVWTRWSCMYEWKV